MSLVTQKISNLLGGVSQRPSTQRYSSQAEEQVNAVTSLSRGVMKRPPTEHIALLSAETDGWDDAFIHLVDRDEDERFHVVVADGTVKVYDAINGEEYPVETPFGTDYLADPTGKGFRAVTVGDTTFIVNRGVEVGKLTTTAPPAYNQALVYVRQADFSTLYNVTINDVTVSFRTEDMDFPSSRQAISTEAIAIALKTLLEATSLTGFTINRNGSTLHIFRADDADFALAVEDGLADNGLKAVKGSVQAFEDLPARAVHGFVAEIEGSIVTSKDNYFVKYDDLGDAGKPGIWRECPAPGSLVALDPATMPHRLALKGEIGVDTLKHQGISVAALGRVEGSLPEVSVEPWDSYELPTAEKLTGFHLGGATYTVTEDARYFAAFHNFINYSLLPPWLTCAVRLYKNSVVVDEITYASEQNTEWPLTKNPGPITSGISLFQGNLSCENVETDDVMEIRMEFSDGDASAGLFRGPLLEIFDARLYGDDVRIAIVGTGTASPGAAEAAYFPRGSVITLSLDSDDFVFTVAAEADQSISAVRAGLEALVDADAGYSTSDSAADRFTITPATGSIALGTLSIAYPALTFYNSSLGLTVDEHVGAILTNVTDGSTGVITSNTSNSITVASMTGGADNTISVGDLCAVFVDDEEVGTHFVFSPVPWKPRGAGDIDVVTFPSFVGSRINDVFFYQNRLGFLSKENIVLTGSGDLFNVFRYTATDLRADDPIDIRSAHSDVTIFDAAFLWSEGLYVKSDNVWFSVTGAPALTPTTVRLDPVGRYPSAKDPRPVVVGERVYFTRAKSGNTQVFEVLLTDEGRTTKAVDITKEIPTYIEGAPVALVGDGAEGFLALLTDANGQRRIYVYSWLDRGGQKVISSWGRWEFPAGTRILAMDFADGRLGIVRQHADGTFIEQLDLDLTPNANEKIAYLDRRISSVLGASGWEVEGEFPTYDSMTDTTTWTMPYAIAVDGSQGAVLVTNRTDGTIYETTRPTPTTVAVTGEGDLTEELVYIGQSYQYLYRPTGLYIRGPEGLPETGGRLQLQFLEVFYRDTTDFTLTVSSVGKDAEAYIVDIAAPTADRLRLPVLSRNTAVSLEFANSTPGPCALSEIDWQAYYTNIRRRI